MRHKALLKTESILHVALNIFLFLSGNKEDLHLNKRLNLSQALKLSV